MWNISNSESKGKLISEERIAFQKEIEICEVVLLDVGNRVEERLDLNQVIGRPLLSQNYRTLFRNCKSKLQLHTHLIYIPWYCTTSRKIHKTFPVDLVHRIFLVFSDVFFKAIDCLRSERVFQCADSTVRFLHLDVVTPVVEIVLSMNQNSHYLCFFQQLALDYFSRSIWNWHPCRLQVSQRSFTKSLLEIVVSHASRIHLPLLQKGEVKLDKRGVPRSLWEDATEYWRLRRVAEVGQFAQLSFGGCGVLFDALWRGLPILDFGNCKWIF